MSAITQPPWFQQFFPQDTTIVKVDVAGDGDCMFTAVAESLIYHAGSQPYTGPRSGPDMRRYVASRIQPHMFEQHRNIHDMAYQNYHSTYDKISKDPELCALYGEDKAWDEDKAFLVWNNPSHPLYADFRAYGEIHSEWLYMEGCDTIDKFRSLYLDKAEIWGDELAVQLMQEHLGITLLVLDEERYREMSRPFARPYQVFGDDPTRIVVIVELKQGHYWRIVVNGQTTFTSRDLPPTLWTSYLTDSAVSWQDAYHEATDRRADGQAQWAGDDAVLPEYGDSFVRAGAAKRRRTEK